MPVSRGIVPLRNDPDFRPVALGVRPVPSRDHMRQSRPPSLDRDALETDHARSPQRHRHLPLHRHRGQHCALGARPGCHAHRGCSPHRATESAIRVHACVHLKIIFGIVPVGLGGQIGSHAATRDSMQRPKSMPVCWPCRAFLSLGSFPVQRESWARPRDVLRRGSLPRRSSAGAWRSATRPHTA
jgi:hypothetical protein